jgi:hypothetical protein
MAIACDRVRELASGFVLGALEPDEMAAVRDHLDHCGEPHPELAELGGILPYLAVTPEPVEPPAWLRGSVIAAVEADLRARHRVGRPTEHRAVEPAPATATVPAFPSLPMAQVISLDAASRSRRSWAATWITRVAAVIAVVSLAGYAIMVQGDLNNARLDQSNTTKILNVLIQPDTVKVQLIDNEGKGAGGFAALRPNGDIVVSLNHLAVPSGDQTYMVWLTGDSGAVIKVGSLSVGDDGKASLVVDNVPTSTSMWISVCREPNSKVDRPTGPTILSGTISL